MSQRSRRGILAALGVLAVIAVAGALGAAGGASRLVTSGVGAISAGGGTATAGAPESVYVPSTRGTFVRPDALTRVEESSRVGVFEPGAGIAVANLTVRPGQYVVRYGFEARLDTAYQPVDLRCGVADANGTGSFLIDDPRPLLAGSGWGSHAVESTFSLPDITLGIRCFPTATGFGSVSFRDITLSVTTIPY